jgi:hypothetical protein
VDFSFYKYSLHPKARRETISNDEIQRRAKVNVKFTEHARLAMGADNVTVDDVISALMGDVIEEYPDDKPFPSCLVCGKTTDKRALHVACAMPKHVDTLIPNFNTFALKPQISRFLGAFS